MNKKNHLTTEIHIRRTVKRVKVIDYRLHAHSRERENNNFNKHNCFEVENDRTIKSLTTLQTKTKKNSY